MSFDINIYQDAAKAERKIPSYTFTVNGQESLYWCPNEYAVQRVINRLKLGRCGEAFGAAGVVSAGADTALALTKGHNKKSGRGKVVAAGEVTTETVTMKSGRVKTREKKPGYLYELDGKARENKIFTSETEAKAACAVEAFMSRGKLNRFAEAEATFLDKYGKKCKVQLLGRKIIAKDEDGGLWAVGLVQGEDPWFKSIVPAPPR